MTSTRSLDPAFVSTDDIMAAAGIARRTVSVWVEMGFLPPPLKVSLGIRGVFNRFPAYLAAAPRRGRFLMGGVGAGLAGMRAFVDRVRREHDAAPPAERVSPVALLVRGGAPTAVVGELQLAALAEAGL